MKDDEKDDVCTDKDGSIVEGTLDDLLPGIGGLVKRLRKQSPELDRKIEEKDDEIKKRLEEGYSPEPKVQYGVRVRTLAPEGGAAKKETKSGSEPTEPVTDLFDEGDYIRVVAELPGMTEDKIRVTLQGTTLAIAAREKDRNFYKEVSFPCEVELGKKRYMNGILEITLEKVTDA